jgi:hypothetical protein
MRVIVPEGEIRVDECRRLIKAINGFLCCLTNLDLSCRLLPEANIIVIWDNRGFCEMNLEAPVLDALYDHLESESFSGIELRPVETGIQIRAA